MQKTLDILERNVQWIALSLGGIFLLWSVYSYVITPPAVASVGGTKLAPGAVAPYTHESVVKNVQTAMNDNAGIQIAQLNVAQAFDAAMSGAGQMAVASLPSWSIGLGNNRGPTGTGTTGSQGTKETRIAALPELPPAQVVSAQSGLSVVQLPQQNNNPNPNARNPNVQQVAQVEDTDWVAVFFKVSADAIKKAFEAPLNGQQLSPELYNTTVLEVEVQRQEAEGMDPATGQPVWPKDNNKFDVVPALKIYRSDVKKMPAEAAPANQKYEYWDWAEKNPQLVYTPEFYQVTGGTPPPDLAAIYNPTPNANNAAPAPDNAAGGADNGAQDSSTQPAAPQGTTQPAAPATGKQSAAPSDATRSLAAANPTYSYAPDTNDPRSESYYRSRYGRPGGNGRPGYGRPVPGRGGQPFPIPGQNFNQNFAAGEGKIDPLNMTDDLKIWAYDDTAKPGQTYRYRMIYKLRNPVFGTTNVADPKLSGQLALVGPPSNWTGPVTVPEKTKFWLATLGANKANLDVFTFDKGANGQGEWKATHQTLTPGDQVPGTDWTLVDVRGSEGRDHYVLLTSDTGQMSKRDLNVDRSDPAHQDLLNQTNPNNGENGTGSTNTAPPPGAGRRYAPPPPSRGFRGR